ncbi:hypothetical protein HZA96_01165 [Candidatus Woesearchaeota archaeon]|nr:hypothetical protein [Candidatus Woesearchaeota archaeon]
MPTLIVNVSTGKGTWIDVNKIIDAFEWKKIIVVTNDFGKENFKAKKPIEVISFNSDALSLDELTKNITEAFKGKIADFEVALNIVSGAGKEHMAIITALIKNGCGFKLITVNEKNEVVDV